jgi:hypothetical protein
VPKTTDLRKEYRLGTAMHDASAPMMSVVARGRIRGLFGYLQRKKEILEVLYSVNGM